MSSVESGSASAGRQRRRLTVGIRDSIRELSIQLSLLNHQVSARLELKDVDLNCLDAIGRHGPISPSALARTAGLHPATMTGILDRLERGGWVARERDPNDRRAVVVRALPDRTGEVFALYAGMNTAMEDLCGRYSDTELELLADFLARTTGLGKHATEDLSQG